MKKIYNYILLSVLAIASAGCINEELNNDIPTAESGDEVQFGLSLPDAKTRTVYGDEANNAFPIYWVNEDKVQIFSPQCLKGRRSAEYKVAVDGSEQNYATSLTKTGAYGVQWGDEETADFYSLYPSGNYTLSDDHTKAEGITINYSQNILVDGDDVKSDMEDCLMYAKTTGVTRGETVNLHYDPISTVLMLTLSVAENADATADSFTIQSISVEADTDIAGTFSLNIADGSFGGFVSGTSSKTVLTQITNSATGGYPTLTNNEKIEVPLFLAPVDKLNTKNWKIKVVANNNTYTKTLGIDKTLALGQIHKITLPELKPATTEWKVENWMTNIPRNVYLSEVSIPGSWDTINGQKQGKTDIATQYGYGVRAFHFDTRWRTSGTGTFLGYTSGSVNALSVAGAAESSKLAGVDSDNNRVVLGGAKKFEELLDQIVSKLSPDEYMVLVCTFAQDSYDYEGTNGRWYGEISAICAQEKYANTLVDAKGITSNTLVGDVLGRLLVIVNMPEEINSETALPADSRCLFTFMPLMLSASHFDGTDDNQDKFWISNIVDDKAKAKDSGIIVYNTQAQATANGDTPYDTGTSNRGYAPTIAQRQNICNNILSWSKNNYNKTDYAHNMWIYLGLGGYCITNTSANEASGGPSTIASSMNNWINGKVLEMGTIPSGQTEVIPYYPVGIVLMNYVDQYQETVKNILLLNNKYRLQYDPNQPTDYKPAIQSVAVSYSSGMNDQGVSAFGWE